MKSLVLVFIVFCANSVLANIQIEVVKCTSAAFKQTGEAMDSDGILNISFHAGLDYFLIEDEDEVIDMTLVATFLDHRKKLSDHEPDDSFTQVFKGSLSSYKGVKGEDGEWEDLAQFIPDLPLFEGDDDEETAKEMQKEFTFILGVETVSDYDFEITYGNNEDGLVKLACVANDPFDD